MRESGSVRVRGRESGTWPWRARETGGQRMSVAVHALFITCPVPFSRLRASPLKVTSLERSQGYELNPDTDIKILFYKFDSP